jgi:hypothetical protein
MSRTEPVQVFAVVRYAKKWTSDDPQAVFSVVEVLPSADEATNEVSRLNALHPDEGVIYYLETCRWYPNGRRID